MNIIEFLLMKLIGVFMPLDLIIFGIIIFLMKKIENWPYRILASFAMYIAVSEIIKLVIKASL